MGKKNKGKKNQIEKQFLSYYLIAKCLLINKRKIKGFSVSKLIELREIESRRKMKIKIITCSSSRIFNLQGNYLR